MTKTTDTTLFYFSELIPMIYNMAQTLHKLHPKLAIELVERGILLQDRLNLSDEMVFKTLESHKNTITKELVGPDGKKWRVKVTREYLNNKWLTTGLDYTEVAP